MVDREFWREMTCSTAQINPSRDLLMNTDQPNGPFIVKETPLDPITGLDQLFRDDNDPDKVNLVVGVYQNEQSQSPVLRVVKDAEARLLKSESSKSYLPVPGEQDYRLHTEKLVFGQDHPVVLNNRVSSMQTPGGTGALRLAAEFIFDHVPDATIWISDPAYPNHPGIFGGAGLKTQLYPYYSLDSTGVTFSEMMSTLEATAPGDVVLLHACCHNPSGADLSLNQWKQLGEFVREKRLYPIIDFAYLGFASGLEEDAEGLRAFFSIATYGLITVSFSKNFALYGERTGILSFVGVDSTHAQESASRSKTYARRLWSSPPARGARIVSTVLGNPDLRSAWKTEVAEMRDRISEMRGLLSEALLMQQVDLSIFPNLLDNNGMFALTKLTKDNVEQLREKHHIYMLPNGRISIAGITKSNVSNIAKAFAAVVRQ